MCNLNPAQLQAAHAPAQQALYLRAGAGTGKTKTLIERLLYLASQVAPAKLLVLVFNRQARAEIRTRCRAFSTQVFTFHSFCLRLLQQHGQHLPLPYASSFTFMTPFQQDEWLKQALGSAGLSRYQSSLPALKAYLAKFKKGLIATPLWDKRPAWKVFWQTYSHLCHQAQVLDFDDLTFYSYYLLRHHPPLLAAYQQQYSHILVDEGQDLDYYQTQLLRLLGRQSILFLVGDPYQNIYGFRGSLATYMTRLATDLKLRAYALTTNYRSGAAIIAKANALLPATAALTAVNPHPGVVVYQACADPTQEAAYVLQQLQTLVTRDGYQYHQIAILARKHFVLTTITTALERAHIPYHRLASPSGPPLTTPSAPSAAPAPLAATAQQLVTQLWSSPSPSPPPSSSLVLASIHQVKGLEFKVVFLLGCEQPTWLNPLLAVVNLAEERRLAYVAVTRAQDQLFLTSVRRRPSLTQPARLKPLTFLKEMGF
ncbi:ATP-dependent helicase [Candidatus Phytoplasma melaleucae]|uniref:DNA 3'-5' helicase n=1 Tax=Candidatus Phytoplasma melaleucae TaxID=2982630 RepID=A0ABT9DDW9_9MOLU|nr:ATP-dependent helicase ['Melaleuca sp.' phytoplasma]MDO8168210.1 ATP-dependent helicase ['Melaleuca sp.' phytoplasma]